MSGGLRALTGAEIFDGTTRHARHALVWDGGVVRGIVPEAEVPEAADVTCLTGGLLCPGFVDLQVNGGGGVLFNDDQSVAALRMIAAAHAGLGATSILPTLITDTPDRTDNAISAVADAIDQGVDGIIGLHLEGPHLSVPRKGAHDATLIRAMDDADLARLLDAAIRLPLLKITVAPETVTPDQIAALHDAGVLVSLGHSDAGFATCQAAASAGARCVTHLFNAMSQLGNREPGLVGAALTLGSLSAGLIADGVHVHEASVRAAMAAKAGPGQMFLVSDAMAVAGSDIDSFTLNDRRILRRDGRLTLENGTLAGADLDLLTAVRNMVLWGAASEEVALAMATSIPADLCAAACNVGRLEEGAKADILHLMPGQTTCAAIWQSGRQIV
ncbi:N-acetylglucosamine-6-phosphate deacetylase [Jannaschia sp. CCS1]|uniref:N-acetylglucosamine-6-phosphate deacetylase n=1 Tax=Jannaschia sp. (strain CCS1) TaxID=290400 RepID=UPI000053DE4D|nr:N-acetylglucosamine-6-phosphate deacetylase [Jannaschia sp. CCS1]ABD54278.1 N-acetylglucosamine 6-phosphate deacetylase [Jannaschia sp. CCS1]